MTKDNPDAVILNGSEINGEFGANELEKDFDDDSRFSSPISDSGLMHLAIADAVVTLKTIDSLVNISYS